MIIRFILILLLSVPSVVKANFWLGPCCSGYMCGIIPCDGACSGKAFMDFGKTMTEGYAKASQSAMDITSSVASCEVTSSEHLDMLNSQFKSSFDLWYEKLDQLSMLWRSSLSSLEKNIILQKERYFDKIFSLLKTMVNQSFTKKTSESTGTAFESLTLTNHLEEAVKKTSSVKKPSNELKSFLHNQTQLVIAQKKQVDESYLKTKYNNSIAKEHALKGFNGLLKLNERKELTEDEVKSVLIVLSHHTEKPNIELSLLPDFLSRFSVDGYIYKNDFINSLIHSTTRLLPTDLSVADSTSINRTSLALNEMSNHQLNNYLSLRNLTLTKGVLNEAL